MAKMFYNMSETKATLGRSEDEIKQFVREGRLREFRDGATLMFKADQVDSLKAQLGGGGGIEPVDLGPSDSGAAIGLVDSRGGSATGIGLADTGGIGSGVGSGIGSGIASSGSGLSSGVSGSGLSSGVSGSGLSGLGSAGSGMMNLKEDTALAADLGMSGTVGGVPSPARTGGGSGLGSAGGSRGGSGINVFGEEPERVDPMAQTAISSSGSIGDLNLESVGSGSGLLDLTRESDDTSLGAELLDEISPGSGKRPSAPPDTGAMTAIGGSGVGLEAPRGGVIRGTGGVTYMEAPDPMGFALGGMALGTAAVLLVGILALTAALFGVKIDWMDNLAGRGFLIMLAILFAAPILFFVFFMLGSKGSSAKR